MYPSGVVICPASSLRITLYPLFASKMAASIVCLICQRYKFKSKSQHTVLCSIAKDISLQCHQEDGDGDFAAEGQEDMTRVGGATTIDVGVIDGVKYIARIGGTTTIEMPAIPCIKHIGRIGGVATIDIPAIPRVENSTRIGRVASIEVFAVPRIKDIARVGGVTSVEVFAIPRVKHIG